jgi:hypothetical protein
MIRWRIHTESGSLYEVREIAGDWRMSVPTPPSSSDSLDLRGTVVSIAPPVPWPPRLGDHLLVQMEWTPEILLPRYTSAVVRIETEIVREDA